MRKQFTIILLTLCIAAAAQHGDKHQKFDPERYQADLEQFITCEACLTPQEAAKFFPLYREMMKQQQGLFAELRNYRHYKPASEEGCREAVVKKDEVDIRVKELQQQYHQRFLRIISASKLYDVINAENKFHRQSFKRMSQTKNAKKQ